MNADLKDLRVAVVPTETGNGIDQSSSVEQILDCEETQLYPLTDYFKAQNDEDIDLLHWSFLIDIRTNEDLTGSNIDGIHMDNKASAIRQIQTIVERWGETTSSELMLESSPCVESIGNSPNVCTLVEEFKFKGVKVVTYVNDGEIDSSFVDYDELDDDLLEEVLAVMQDYDAEMDRTEKRCRS